jgi:cell division protein FtsA
MAVGRHGFIAGLDVGTTKVCCFVARIDGAGMRVVGIGHQVSRGIRSGAVVDMDAAEESIRAAVDAAERMADETIREVYVSFAGGQPASHTVGVEVSIAGHQVGESDVNRVLEQGRTRNEPGERQVVHAIPVGYTIDGSPGIRDPRGMYGERLGVNMHVVTAATGPLRNLATCVERCHLKITGTVISPYASGLACLVEDEMDLGVTVIDLGGGTTSLAVFYDGALVLTDVVPIGGGHVTNDIARGLSTPMVHAERMKTLFGSAVAGTSDENEIIDVPQVGEIEHHSPNHVPRSILVGIIKPRVEETFELVRDRLARSGLDRVAGRRVVLCGGASQLQGTRDLAQRVLDKQVRMGRPIRVNGLAEATGGPAFATCAGLLSYALRARTEAADGVNEPEEANGGRFARLGQWLRANF